ncbi:hypothetical protein [Streptomyces javensis]
MGCAERQTAALLPEGAGGGLQLSHFACAQTPGPGAAQRWRRIREVQTLGAGRVETSYLGVPPVDRTSGPYLHWRVPLGPGRYLTDANRLREALVRASVAELGVGEGDDL